MNKNFKTRAEEAGAEDFFEDGSQTFRVSEDDGNFFVDSGGIRAVWYFGQELTRREFNREANKALKQMGYKTTYKNTGFV